MGDEKPVPFVLQEGAWYTYTDDEGNRLACEYIGMEGGKYKFLPEGFPPFSLDAVSEASFTKLVWPK